MRKVKNTPPITLRILSTIITLIIIIIFIYSSILLSGNLYDYFHPIQNPIERGDDLGGGLLVLSAMAIASFLSIPAFFIIYRLILKKLKILWR